MMPFLHWQAYWIMNFEAVRTALFAVPIFTWLSLPSHFQLVVIVAVMANIPQYALRICSHPCFQHNLSDGIVSF
jgi:peptidoglycan/LPS O-acetylase OafA/YrhL